MGDTIRLLWVALRGGWQLALDAAGDVIGSSLPYAVDEVMQPAILTRLLREGALAPEAVVQVRHVTRRDIPSISSNCENLVLDVEGDGVADSLFVKLPMTSLTTRWFFTLIHSWKLESHFFQSVAHQLPLRTPRTYATAWRGSRFFLIQENLHDDDSVQLFTNPDMLAGPTLDQVHACLDALARLHSTHYGKPREELVQVLPLTYHPMLSPTMGTLSRALHRAALEPCKKKLPGVMTPEVEAAYHLTRSHWDLMLECWYGGPWSLLHGDSHLGNFFVSGDDMGMLDWQAAHWGNGVRDVAYFLINSLPADALAQHERDLIAFYVEQRSRHGAGIEAQQAWEDYRGFSYHPLMTIVVAIGFGALNPEQEAVMAEVFRRSVAAAQRLDYPVWLSQRIADSVNTGRT